MDAQQSVVDLFRQIAGNEFGFFGKLKSVTDVLNPQFLTVSCDASFGDFVRRKDVRTLSSMAVIDPDDGELVGVLNRSTILRCYPRHLNTLIEKDDDDRMRQAGISTLTTRPMPTIKPTAALLDALELLLQGDCDCLFVSEVEKQAIGVITPIEFVKTMMVYYQINNRSKPLQRLRLMDLDQLQIDEIFYRGAQTARDIMRPLPTVGKDEPVLAVVEAMHRNDTSPIGLVDERDDVSAVVSIDDVLVGLQQPVDVVALTQNASDEASGRNPLDLIPLDELCCSKDPVLSEPAHAIAETKTVVIEPTARMQDVLMHFVSSETDVVLLVKSNLGLEGVITVREILRIFKTLLRIQSWESAT